MKRIVFQIPVLLSILFFAGCGNNLSVTAEDNEFEPIVLTMEQEAMVSSGNSFAISMLSQINAKESSSYIISPLSLQFVLGMLLNGAEEDAANEICQVLGYGSGGIVAVNDYCSRLIRELPTLDKLTQFVTARSILVSPTSPLRKTYAEIVVTRYNALCETVDFSKPASIREKVNTWCSKNTNGLIPEMITQADLERPNWSQLIALLLDASWFKGVWSDKFDKKETETEVFTREDGSTCRVKFMKKTDNFLWKPGTGVDFLKLPYGNGAYSMIIILPTKDLGIDEWLKGDVVIPSSFVQRKIEVWLPRFEIQTSVDLKPVLQEMGIRKIFSASGTALAPMFESVGTMLSDVKQKATIRVDETGTEAAAVTEAGIWASSTGVGAESVFRFHADHPFLFLITESSTGAILSAGAYHGE
jgi:serpin B